MKSGSTYPKISNPKVFFKAILIRSMDMKIDFIELLPSEVSAQIIEYLDITTVFVCSTVSRKWRDTIINLKVKSKFQCNWKTGEPRLFKRKCFNYLILCKL